MYRTYFLIFLAFSSVWPVFAQGHIKLPIKLEIYVQSNNRCQEGKLVLYGRLKNVSKRSVIVDRNLMWIGLSASKSIYHDNRYDFSRLIIIRDMGPEYNPDFVILKPKETTILFSIVSLTDDFFATSGKYSFQARYLQVRDLEYRGIKVWKGDLNSNSLEIDPSYCR
jgi:hypothetical protein